jgi:hypothetical protein
MRAKKLRARQRSRARKMRGHVDGLNDRRPVEAPGNDSPPLTRPP